MKIGILTFQCAHNYGAVLQAYALQEVLKNLGHEVKVINYRPDYIINVYKTPKLSISVRHPLWMVKHNIKVIVKYPRALRRHKAFTRFIEGRLNLTSPCDKETVVSDMDTYIFGSDQIWNTGITGGYDDIFWGKLPFEKGNKKYITYAASMGKDSIADEDKKWIAGYLKNFDAISVRENSLMNMLAPLTDKDVRQVLDPTLLAPRSLWDKLDDNVQERGYVLVYQVRHDKNTMEFANHIAHQLNAKVIILEIYINWKEDQNRKSCASPEDFVSYIKHASCVVTTSFHGTAFSVIFNKPFYCLELGDGEDGRSRSLLHSLRLDDRMVDKLARPQFTEVDYSEANQLLDGLRKSSEQFLTDNLK